MCSISGLYIKDNKQATKEQIEKIYNIIEKAENRGRDSFGVCYIYKNGLVDEVKSQGKVSEHKELLTHKDNLKIIINNNRAEPTTEYIKDKHIEDIQPFCSNNKRIVLAHNGVIANDKELKKEFNLDIKTKIDSAVLAEYLSLKWSGGFSELAKILKEKVIGSYALAINDRKQPDVLYLAVNYKPLYLEIENNAIYFTSLETYFNNSAIGHYFNSNSKVISVKPYTLLKIQGDTVEEVSLWKKDSVKKALVICSGGLDSTVVANHYKTRGYEVTLLNFKYKCRAEKKEEDAVRNIAKYFSCDSLFVETDIFKNVIKHSRLTGTKDLVKEGGGEASAELAWEWVPARNLIMLSISTGIAEAYNYDVIALGNNLEESGAYPDNEMAFIQRFSEVLPFATNLQNRVRIEMPIGNLMKHEIVKKGLLEKAPIHLSWSCYEGGEIHCGSCGPCYMRKKGFKMNGEKDTIKYKI